MAGRVFDCFTFFNEFEILELRLKQHFDAVDKFVIVESPLTFTGQPKPLHFYENRERYAAFMDKINHIVVEDMPEASDPFVREGHQRNALVRGLSEADNDDLVIVSDADELLRPEAIEAARQFDGYTEFDMAMYIFFLNFREKKRGWTAAYGVKKRYIPEIDDLSKARWDRSKIRGPFGERGSYQIIDNAGWHFTHLGGIEKLQKKFQAYSHANDPWPKSMMTEGALYRHFTSGGIIGNFKELGEYTNIDNNFPVDIVDRQEHYKSLGFIRDVYEALNDLQYLFKELRTQYAIYALRDLKPQRGLSNLPARDFLTMSGIDEFPEVELPNPDEPLISAGKTATQSSVSEWSIGRTPDEDARGALSGVRTGRYSFHTQYEHMPWWQVDLETAHMIHEVRIYNRIFPAMTAKRANRIAIDISEDGIRYLRVFAKLDDDEIGGIDGHPLIWKPAIIPAGRLIRIVSMQFGCLHLDQVEVYGKQIALH